MRKTDLEKLRDAHIWTLKEGFFSPIAKEAAEISLEEVELAIRKIALDKRFKAFMKKHGKEVEAARKRMKKSKCYKVIQHDTR